uniref:GLTSCR1 domain-containing protein n=1 Tax=Meloidogyne hapla TaxID=6305 RepID=A0A1I8BHK9_MELHA
MMISFSPPSIISQTENRLPQTLQRPIQRQGQIRPQKQTMQQNPLPNFGLRNTSPFKANVLSNNPLANQLSQRTGSGVVILESGIGQLPTLHQVQRQQQTQQTHIPQNNQLPHQFQQHEHTIRPSTISQNQSTSNVDSIIPPGFETVAEQREQQIQKQLQDYQLQQHQSQQQNQQNRQFVQPSLSQNINPDLSKLSQTFNKSLNVNRGQTLHQIQRQHQTHIPQNNQLPQQFQQHERQTLQQQIPHLQEFNRQYLQQKQYQPHHQSQQPQQNQSKNSVGKSYFNWLTKQNSSLEEINKNNDNNQQEKIIIDLTSDTDNEEENNQNIELLTNKQKIFNIEKNQKTMENINDQLKNNEDINQMKNNKQNEIVSDGKIANILIENFAGDIHSSNKQKQPLEGTSGIFGIQLDDQLNDEERQASENLIFFHHSDVSTDQNKDEELRKRKGKSKILSENEEPKEFEIEEEEFLGPINFSGHLQEINELEKGIAASIEQFINDKEKVVVIN